MSGFQAVFIDGIRRRYPHPVETGIVAIPYRPHRVAESGILIGRGLPRQDPPLGALDQRVLKIDRQRADLGSHGRVFGREDQFELDKAPGGLRLEGFTSAALESGIPQLLLYSYRVGRVI